MGGERPGHLAFDGGNRSLVSSSLLTWTRKEDLSPRASHCARTRSSQAENTRFSLRVGFFPLTVKL